MRSFATLLAALLVGAGAVSVAYAQGNSAVDEYTETIPDGRGDRPSSAAENGDRANPLPEGLARRFEAAGPDGTAAARLAETTAPDTKSLRTRGANSAKGRPSSDASSARDDDEDGGVGAVISELVNPGTGSGLGIGFPLILGVALVAAMALALIRRLRSEKA